MKQVVMKILSRKIIDLRHVRVGKSSTCEKMQTSESRIPFEISIEKLRISLIISIGIVGSINCDSVGIVDQAFFA